VVDLAKFTARGYARALADLASVPAQIAPRVALRIAADIQQNFSAGVDPYGRAWAPLRPRTLAKGRHPPPLTDTGRGRSGIRVFAMSGAGVAMTSDVSYMGIHQDGSPRMAARKFFPEGVLPAKWRAIWQEELTLSTRARLARG
jgi:phage gpG-like protein